MSFSREAIPVDVLNVIRTLNGHSFEGWIVGGAIRALLMGQSPKDWDLATNAKPEEVQKIFSHVIETGIAYGTVTVVTDSMQIQVTTFRKEGEYENHRRPTNVEYCQNIEEELSRRDFSMNSIAYNPITDAWVDPYHGVNDIKHQWIRAVGSPERRFKEDALRILRALRFQGQTGFTIDEPTLKAMEASSNLLKTLSWERIRDEISKWLVGDYFSMTFETAKKIHLLELFDIPPAPSFKKQWDLIPTIEPLLTSRLVAWFDLYTGNLPSNEKNEKTSKILRQLKYSQSTVSEVCQKVVFLSLPMDLDIQDQRLTLLKTALDIGFDSAIRLLDWKLQQSSYKHLILNVKNRLQSLQKQGYEKKVRPLAINGHQIMEMAAVTAGPQIKQILEQLENWVLDHPDANTLQMLVKQLQTKP